MFLQYPTSKSDIYDDDDDDDYDDQGSDVPSIWQTLYNDFMNSAILEGCWQASCEGC